MRWPWQPDRLRDDESPQGCPNSECMSTRQKRVLEQLVDVVWRDGRAHAIRTAFTLQCTECGMRYHTDGHSTWRGQQPRGPEGLVPAGPPHGFGGLRPEDARERMAMPRPKEKPPI